MPVLPFAADLRKLAVRAIGMGSDRMLVKLLPADRDKDANAEAGTLSRRPRSIVEADAVLTHTGHHVGLE